METFGVIRVERYPQHPRSWPLDDKDFPGSHLEAGGGVSKAQAFESGKPGFKCSVLLVILEPRDIGIVKTKTKTMTKQNKKASASLDALIREGQC